MTLVTSNNEPDVALYQGEIPRAQRSGSVCVSVCACVSVSMYVCVCARECARICVRVCVCVLCACGAGSASEQEGDLFAHMSW